MKLIQLVLLAALASPSLFATPMLTLDPPDINAGYGTPGGWGFSIYWQEEPGGADPWFFIDSVFFVEPTGSGTFHDLVSAEGHVIAPDTTWSRAFDSSNPNSTAWTGLGWYEISDGVIPPLLLDGTIIVSYQAYDAHPEEGGNMVDSGILVTPASVNVLDPVSSEVPEPAAGLLALAGLAMAACFRRLRG